ncbi:MAG: OsmC family protein [Armatimonadota bacterium]
MGHQVTVSWVDGKAWRAQTRGQSVIADTTPEYGGMNLGMTPVELLIAALGSCIGVTLSFYNERHPMLDLSQVTIAITWEDAEDKPSRISTIYVDVSLPSGLTDDQRASLYRVMNACKVHHTLQQGVATTINISY